MRYKIEKASVRVLACLEQQCSNSETDQTIPSPPLLALSLALSLALALALTLALTLGLDKLWF